MLTLKEKPTLKDYQKYVTNLEIERGFQDEDVIQKCLLLSEELGELYEAVIASEKLNRNDYNPLHSSIDQELADIIIVLCAIANRFAIDLEEEFRNIGLNSKSITLPALQRYIRESEGVVVDMFRCCLILGVRIGKLYKAIRKQSKVVRVDRNSEFVSIGEASSMIMRSLCQIANYCDIDMEQAFRTKESLNKGRVWT